MTIPRTLAALLLLFSPLLQAQDKKLHLIPLPQSIEQHEGSFRLSPATRIHASAELLPIARYLSDSLQGALGFQLRLTDDKSKADIVFELAEGMDKEAYQLSVSKDKILLRASEAAGVFYGVQSLRQLLPVEAYASSKQEGVTWAIPCLEIKDAPRFPWRGFMIDSSRHYQPLPELLRLIDLISQYKMNVFHWHLIDGHGWRMQSKKFPKLTSVGAWRMQPDYPSAGKTGRYGGYYTQEEIRELIAYAAERHITVIPEVEMPGHSAAALASYPKLLACRGVTTGVHHFYSYPSKEQRFPPCGADVMCAGKESTFAFLEEILEETCELFPSEYIHIGGDEVQKAQWGACPDCRKRMEEEGLKSLEELQSYFIKRVESILHKKGRKLMGWDEILEGGLPERSAVMSWRGIEGGIEAAKQGKKIVMSPQDSLYLDRGQSKSPFHPAHWPGYVPIDVSYNFNPIPQVLRDAGKSHLVMGVQGNLWTIFTNSEYLNDLQSFPRLCAIAEVAWTEEEQRNFEDFSKRLEVDKKRLDEQGVSYWKEPVTIELGGWSQQDKLSGTPKWSRLDFDLSGKLTSKGEIHLGFQYESGAHRVFIKSAHLYQDGKLISKDIHEGISGLSNSNNIYKLKLQNYNPKAKYRVSVQIAVDNKARDGKAETPDSKGRVFFVVMNNQ